MNSILHQCCGFEWAKGNVDKNQIKHQVVPAECEQLFFNQPLLISDDAAHSKTERRFYALGRTNAGRLLFVAFTVRDKLIRVISARDMSKKEQREYSCEKDSSTI